MSEPSQAEAGGSHEDEQQLPAAEWFASELRRLRAAAGNPSFRKLAGRSGKISHTTLHEAASGTRFASWETTREFVRACGGDEVEWRGRWERAAAAGHGGETTPYPETTRTSAETEVPAAKPARGPGAAYRRMAIAAGTAAVLGAAGWSVVTRSDARPPPDPVGTPVGPRIAGDQSRFIADITVPDGTVIETGETFIKVWEVQNSGTVPWYNRYIQREDLPPVPGNCQTPDRVAINNTLPNERVKISVTVTAPHTPGSCMVKWKMVDDEGRLFFPSSRPVYFLVTVIAPG